MIERRKTGKYGECGILAASNIVYVHTENSLVLRRCAYLTMDIERTSLDGHISILHVDGDIPKIIPVEDSTIVYHDHFITVPVWTFTG